MSDIQQVNAAEEKLNKSLDTFYDQVYQGYILGIQRENYLCAADCCRKFDTQKEVAKCADLCSEKLKKVYTKIEQESDAMNQALNRCIMTCQEKQRRNFNKEFDMLEPKQKQQYEEGVMKCLAGCFDEHMSDLPKLKDRLINFINKS